MLTNLIVIDYSEGSGGEYISNIINSHKGFYNESPEVENLQDVPNLIQKYFNSKSLISADWDENFDFYINDFLNQCKQLGVDSVAISYHLHKFPNHITIINQHIPQVRYVKIDQTNCEYLIKLDFIRKILFREFKSQNWDELKYRIHHLDKTKQIKIIDLFKHDALLGMDILLIENNLSVTYEHRSRLIDQILNRSNKLPSNDISINYEDFFIKFDNIKNKYYNLCNALKLKADDKILRSMTQRNKKNYQQLIDFSNNFDIIKKDFFQFGKRK